MSTTADESSKSTGAAQATITREVSGDLLHAAKARTTGPKALLWYLAIAAFAALGVVYVTGMFSKPQVVVQSKTTESAAVADEGDSQKPVFKGRVVRAATSPSGDAVQVRRTMPGSANPAPSPAFQYPPTSYIPDVSQARAAFERIALPTPAPGELGSQIYGASSRLRVIYPEQVAPAAAASVGSGPAMPFSPAALMNYQMAQAQSTPTPAPTRAPISSADEAAAQTIKDETMPGRRRPPSAKYMVIAGTPISAQTDVAIESDIPGPVTAHITQDVLDPFTGAILIPRSTRLVGLYHGLASGQSHLGITWSRMIFPDHSSIALDNLPALNESGQVGVTGRVDDHRAGLIRTTLIGGILGTIADILTARATGSSSTNLVVINGQPSPFSNQILNAMNQLNGQHAQQAPTIDIGPSAPFTLYVDRDMIFDGPYQPMEAASE